MTPVWKKIEIGALITIAGAVITFYIDWKIDEKSEESVMFDTPAQKVITVGHAEVLPTADMKIKIERDEDFKKLMIEKFQEFEKQSKVTDSLVRLGVFLSNKAAKGAENLNRNVEHALDHVEQ